MTAYSGERFDLDNGTATASIGAVAAVLRELRVGGVRVTESVGDDVLPPMGCGIVLAPWPNRVRDGRWTWNGAEQLLDISERGTGNASHGLLRNVAYELRERAADGASVTLGAFIAPQHGWPFRLDTEVTYALEVDGLTITHRARNLGDEEAVWAVGAHPYLRVGEHDPDTLSVRVSGASRLRVDGQKIPVETLPVDAASDLRVARPVADLDLDLAFGDLGIPAGGRADVAELAAPDGARVTIWHDAAFGWCQSYTPRNFPRPTAGDPDAVGRAIALEPMTAPPDALNSGVDLVRLAPGESWAASWGVRYTPASVAGSAALAGA